MIKPTIFFSHSSLDKDVLFRLKNKFIEKTGSTIDVFLSSDGQSIPFGRNWVYRVQEALNRTSLMFVFITPNSLNSSWIYFEAGFVFSKDIKVVPVGFLGTNLSSVSPPISLLQGFNISSHDGLDNLLAITNKVYSYNHNSTFSEIEYKNIVLHNDTTVINPLGKYFQDIDQIQISQNKQSNENIENNISSREVFIKITEFLDRNQIQYRLKNKLIETFQMNINIISSQRPKPLSFLFDPISIESVIPHVNLILRDIFTESMQSFSINFLFKNQIECIILRHKLTAYLFDPKVSFDDSHNFRYKDLQFSLSKPFKDSPLLSVNYEPEIFDYEQIIDLIDFLFLKKVLFRKNQYFDNI